MEGEGKVLIVGGTSGIGKATAGYLAGMFPEMKQYVPAREELDITARSSIALTVREHGPFDYIVYSAGTNELAWVGTRHIAFRMEDHFSVNCSGLVSLVSEHIRTWEEAPLSVVAVSSDAGRIPMRGSVAYCVSKAALNMAVRVMARELAPVHRINAVAPGMVDGTPMTEYIERTVPEFRGWTPEHALTYERASTPTGRRASLTEVASTIAWVLTGPHQMTGAIIDITGGR